MVLVLGRLPAAHPTGTWITFDCSVTSPVLARSRPVTVAPVEAVIDWAARIVPWNAALVPRLAELPTCQNTLQALAPPVMMMFVAEPMVKLLEAWKTQTELAEVPASVKVPLFEMSRAPPEYTPGVSDIPVSSVRPEVCGVRPAASLYAVVRSFFACKAAALATFSAPVNEPLGAPVNPVTELPGSTPMSPLTVVVPVFVSALPASVPYVEDVPSAIGPFKTDAALAPSVLVKLKSATAANTPMPAKTREWMVLG